LVAEKEGVVDVLDAVAAKPVVENEVDAAKIVVAELDVGVRNETLRKEVTVVVKDEKR
jgi:hypothetical protein